MIMPVLHALRGSNLCLLIVCFLISKQSMAQQSFSLDARLKSPLRDSIAVILDSAANNGIPASPLADKAVEGVSKGASADAVLKAVRTLYKQLKTVRGILGEVPVAELDAATAAFRAGASDSSIVLIKSSLPNRSRIVPYAVLSTLIKQGISSTDATKIVIDQGKRSDDRSLLALSSAIERNIAAGLQAQVAIIKAQERLPHSTSKPPSPSPPRRDK